MKVKTLYKKIGVKDIQELTKNEVTTIASDISIKLCLAFPSQNLKRHDLFDKISSINMFTATMERDLSGAKYVLDNNSIYFNNQLKFEEYPNVAMHECIHFLQMQKSKKQFGLYHFSSGLAINEAAVQLMASEANMLNTSEEKFYDICLKTNTPNYYPLECAILKQISFLGDITKLYDSTLNSNDSFKEDFTNKFGKRTYNFIENHLDKLLSLENDLNYYTNELAQTSNIKEIASFNDIIVSQKKDISKLFFKIQNYIIDTCFSKNFSKIKNEDEIHQFKNKLYNFKNIIGFTNNYTFYNDFYRKMMMSLEDKRDELTPVESGGHATYTALTVFENKKSVFNMFRRLLWKLNSSKTTDIKKINL